MPSKTADKPRWPYRQETVMTAAPNGQWRKRHKRRDYYFGAWDDPAGALDQWRKDWPLITSGVHVRAKETPTRAPVEQAKDTKVTVLAVFTEFLVNTQARVDRGELASTSMRRYRTTMRTAMRLLGPRTLVKDLKPKHFTRLYRDASKNSVYTRERVVV